MMVLKIIAPIVCGLQASCLTMQILKHAAVAVDRSGYGIWPGSAAWLHTPALKVSLSLLIITSSRITLLGYDVPHPMVS